MNHCKDCLHWGNGKPALAANYAPKKHCALVMTNDPDSPGTISVGGDIEYGDDRAELLTDPDFGCLAWQENEIVVAGEAKE